MKIISWNVNGIRAALKSGLVEFLHTHDADVYCFQETKIDDTVLPTLKASIFDVLQKYEMFDNSSKARKGYSGVIILTKTKPISHQHGIGVEEFDREGRVLTIEFPGFFLVNSYFPNSGRSLERMEFKLRFNQAIHKYLNNLKKDKGVLIVGDFNVAHEEIDIARPKDNHKNAGFTDEERAWMTKLLNDGYLDTFRLFNSEGNNYTWWSYMHNAREKNIGWRIDLAVISENLKDKVKQSRILSDVMGSDHCPVFIEIGQ